MYSKTKTGTINDGVEFPPCLNSFRFSRSQKYYAGIIFAIFILMIHCGCSGRGNNYGKAIRMETTAYCDCGLCCDWERGNRKIFRLDFWNRYIAKGKYRGQEYSGLTASGTEPKEPNPGLLRRPGCILFPWRWIPRDGSLAADTRYYPFGTRLYIPGYGYGVVEDRGAAIKGKTKLDLFFDSHDDALEWGRKKIDIYRID